MTCNTQCEPSPEEFFAGGYEPPAPPEPTYLTDEYGNRLTDDHGNEITITL